MNIGGVFFRRLKYRIIAGRWCKHPNWTDPARMGDHWQRYTECKSCGHSKMV